MMSDVFISTSKSGQDLEKRLRTELRKLGVTVFDPRSELHAGDSWRDEIVKAIKNSSNVVIIVTSDFNSSSWTNYELGVAEALNKPILVVHPESVDPRRLPDELRSLQMLTVTPSHIGNSAKSLADALV